MKARQWFEENLKDLKRPLSPSGVVNGLRCPRLFMLRNKWGLLLKLKPYSKAPKLGTLVHRLMKVGEGGVDKVREEVVKEHEGLLERIRKGEDLTGDLARMAKELGELHQKALAVARIHWKKFPPKKHIKTLCREEVLEGEFSMSVTNSMKVPLLGIVDWAVKDSRDGGVWIRDTKTTGNPFESILTGFLYCIPCRMYRILGDQNKEWRGKIKGFILDMIRTPGIKLCSKDIKNANSWSCTPAEAYMKRVEEWYECQEETMESSAIAFNEPVYNREIVSALEYMCKLWNHPPNPDSFCRDQTRSTCYAYKKVCPYYRLCSSDESTWPIQISEFYEVRGDDPKKKGD